MDRDKHRIKSFLKAFNFKSIFLEELGWDNPKGYPFTIDYKGQVFTLTPIAEKRGIQILLCSPDTQGCIPDDKVIKQIERQVEEYAQEHLIIFMDDIQEHQTWIWAKHEYKKSTAYRIHKLRKGQSGESLAQRLITLAIELEEEANLTHQEIADRLKKGFDVEKITKKFYDRFKKEHAGFLNFIQGITSQDDREWYTSVMLNRLMFIYFIQKKGFLGTTSKHTLDGDPNYMRNRLILSQKHNGSNIFHSFYRYFLLRLFSEGLNARERTPELEGLLGNVPYLNGGIFDIHQLERDHPEIQIPDEAFDLIFRFFDEYSWHLDDRPDKAGNEINPDVLGYIFEKYINQKQMGAYYTKEDITEYISKNTIIPFIFEVAQEQCSIAFAADGPVWSLLCDNPDDYIYEAVAKGISLSLPSEIEAGITDISLRGDWNKVAEEQYALPTETWREVVERRKRYTEIHEKIVQGNITSINDLITYNLDIRQFAHDVITYCEGSDLLLAFYESIEKVTVLDPTCGSGAFLFAALNILQPLYAACLDRMQNFVDERDQLDKAIKPHKWKRYYQIDRFRDILKQVAKHHSREYFILKSIIINNLYGVDIMEEAVEICKLRLFLKLVAQVKKPDDIEPLPDIDFNVQAGNTLVGFTSLDEVRSIVENDLYMRAAADEILQCIEQRAKDLERAVENFRKIQTTYEIELDHTTSAEYKQEVRNKLNELRSELNPYLAMKYHIDRNNISNEQQYQQRYEQWLHSHQPFHWFVEFYGIIQRGGFDVIIGNPPYVEKSAFKKSNYTPQDFITEQCSDIYALILERSFKLITRNGTTSFIIPISLICADDFSPLQDLILSQSRPKWMAHFANRPSQLFVGAQKRLTILVVGSENPNQGALYTSRYRRWIKEERNSLITLIEYTEQYQMPLVFKHSIAKIGSQLELNILRKIFVSNKKLGAYSIKDSDNKAYYVRTPGYFCQFLQVLPMVKKLAAEERKPRGELYNDSFRTKDNLHTIMAILNSGLFYWYFIIYSDCRHMNRRDVLNFPIDLDTFEESTRQSLIVLSHRLQEDYLKNKSTMLKSGLEIETFDVKKSKPIIDEIDRILAKHYGFTDEELDFIINYDIKYRMGRGNGEGDEE